MRQRAAHATCTRAYLAPLAILCLGACDGAPAGPPEPGPLVVRAQLDARSVTQAVQVGRAGPLTNQGIPPLQPVAGATVVLTGSNGSTTLAEAAPGSYQGAFNISAGERYEVSVAVGGASIYGVTTVPGVPVLSRHADTLSSTQTIVTLEWQNSGPHARYGIYQRVPFDASTASFWIYTPDTIQAGQPLASCGPQCCGGTSLVVVAFSPSVLVERGFPGPPTSTDTLIGAQGFVGSIVSDQAVYHLANAPLC